MFLAFHTVYSYRYSPYATQVHLRNQRISNRVRDLCRLNLRPDKTNVIESTTIKKIIVIENETYSFSDLTNPLDFLQVMALSINEFFPVMTTNSERLKCFVDILVLFLPKFIAPWIMKHSVIGVKVKGETKLVGFVDLSLQTNSGSRVALQNLSFSERSTRFKDLSPYLCNFLVAPNHRKKGLGRYLLRLCEERARQWGYSELCLHADMSTLAPMKLYLSSNFLPIQMQENSLVFMKKSLK